MPMLGHALYDTATVRAVEHSTIDGLGIPGYTLMERAGVAALRHLRRRWPEARCITVLCGPGNNGGDGLVLARLARAEGLQTHVLCPLGVPERGDAALAAAAFFESGGEIEHVASEAPWPLSDAVVDALFGIGLDRPPHTDLAMKIEALNASGQPVLALDIPSGINADSGHAPGVAVRAALTVTFIGLKCGLFGGAAIDHCGEIQLETLDIPDQAFSRVQPVAWLLDPAWTRRLLPPRRRSVHKGCFGHVLVIGGDHGYGGAARLCAEAALRTGAGWVSVVTRTEHVGALLTARPELMVRDTENLDSLLEVANVLAVGPGLGQGAWGCERFECALASRLPRVLDADALNLLARMAHLPPAEDAAPSVVVCAASSTERDVVSTTPSPTLDLRRASQRRLDALATERGEEYGRVQGHCMLGEHSVITPHPGEAARLLGCTSAEVQRDRFAALRRLVAHYQCVVVLKGAATLIGDGTRTVVCPLGNPGMASGGMGDVLTGVIAALLAQGLAAFDAACCGVWLHAAAADRAAVRGERGLLAGDVIAELRNLANP